MEIIEWADGDAFVRRGAPILALDEAHTSLIHGVAARVAAPGGDAPAVEDAPFLATVEAAGQVRLIAVMTPPHRLIVHGRGATPDDEALRALTAHLRAAGRPLPGVLGPRPLANAFAGCWTAVSGQRVEPGIAMLLYALRAVRDVPAVPGRCRVAVETDRKLLEGWTDAFIREVFGRSPIGQESTGVARRIAAGDYRLWEDGDRPVSLAGRTRPTPLGTSISAVFTPVEHRGRGYASACVASLCQEILDGGKRFCTLFADLANPTSNGIYRRLGFEPVGQFVELDFV